MTVQPVKSFVRSDMLQAQVPPVSERGVVKWLRENLFSGLWNSALTIVGLIVLYLILQASLPWFLNSVWNANSLSECREIVAASAGPDASGACWAAHRSHLAGDSGSVNCPR